jgi:formate dehydrogenase subunit delta
MSETPTGAIDRLVRMANQIALAFRSEPRDSAVADIATHIRSFWTPKMRRDLAAYNAGGGEKLEPLAKAAIESLLTKTNA